MIGIKVKIFLTLSALIFDNQIIKYNRITKFKVAELDK